MPGKVTSLASVAEARDPPEKEGLNHEWTLIFTNSNVGEEDHPPSLFICGCTFLSFLFVFIHGSILSDGDLAVLATTATLREVVCSQARKGCFLTTDGTDEHGLSPFHSPLPSVLVEGL